MIKKIVTDRMILRPWKKEDAPALFHYASDVRIGGMAGWPVHTSVQNSQEIIETILSKEGTYAIVLKKTMQPVGSIGLMNADTSNLKIAKNEAEIGYWIGVPYWGQGLVPQAVQALIAYAFQQLSITKLWITYFEGNQRSLRVLEKCGFSYHHTQENEKLALLDDIRTKHVTTLSKEQYLHQISEKTESMEKHICISNLARIHTTKMGEERIKANLSIDEADVVEYCKAKIKDPKSVIIKKGKNFYVTIDQCMITINSHSFTIITAHKI